MALREAPRPARLVPRGSAGTNLKGEIKNSRRARLPAMCLLAALVALGLRPPLARGQSLALYVTNSNAGTVAEFPPGASGNLAPSAIVSGAATGLLSPSAIAFDSGGKIYVANFASGPFGTGSVTIYAPAGTGNVG